MTRTHVALSIIVLVLATKTVAVEERKLNNPILPIVLGPSYITHSHHVTYYHIDTQLIKNCLKNLENILEATENLLKTNLQENFTFLVNEKLNQSKELLFEQIAKLQLFSGKSKNKRGLINVVGKINKWLFGSLDSDDEENFNKYFNTLFKNQQTLSDEMKNSTFILSTITKTFVTSLNRISENQNKIKNKLELLEQRQVNIADSLYISLIIDNINSQINRVKTILINLETAISFAKINIMHNTIINEFQLGELLNSIPKNKLIQLNNPISYYKIMSPKVKIINQTVIFAIHIPIINPKPFTLYKIIPIPILNQTIVTSKPYLLLNEEKSLSLNEECPKVENVFVCHQDNLSEEESCIESILTQNKNTCPIVNVHYTQTSITRISNKEILVIPAKPVSILNHCTKLKRIFTVVQPTLIIMDQCPIEINGHLFQQDRYNNLYYSLNIPKLELNRNTKSEPTHLELEEMNHKEIKQANQIISTMKITELAYPGSFKPHWTFPLSTLITIILIGAIFSIWKLKDRCQKKRKGSHVEEEIEIPTAETSEKRIPLFSES